MDFLPRAAIDFRKFRRFSLHQGLDFVEVFVLGMLALLASIIASVSKLAMSSIWLKAGSSVGLPRAVGCGRKVGFVGPKGGVNSLKVGPKAGVNGLKAGPKASPKVC